MSEKSSVGPESLFRFGLWMVLIGLGVCAPDYGGRILEDAKNSQSANVVRNLTSMRTASLSDLDGHVNNAACHYIYEEEEKPSVLEPGCGMGTVRQKGCTVRHLLHAQVLWNREPRLEVRADDAMTVFYAQN
eukprot:2724997-Amphidinium_carterae.1